MSRALTLKQNTEFHRAYGKGKVKASPRLVTYAVRGRGPGCRIGITAAKKLGSAVERNRCRRIIRAAFSSVYPFCSGNWDIVFVARWFLYFSTFLQAKGFSVHTSGLYCMKLSPNPIQYRCFRDHASKTGGIPLHAL